jgi:hypothetical protein
MTRGFLGKCVKRVNLDLIGKGLKMDMTQKVSLQSLDEAMVKIHQRIVSEPAYRTVLFKMLAFCQETHSSVDITEEVCSYPEMKASLQPDSLLLSWLIECDGIEEVVLADSEKKERMFRTTIAGKAVFDKENSGNKIATLFMQEPAYVSVYKQILGACVFPKSRAEIETMLRGNPILESPKIYANYFIETLENAGGLEWRDRWQTTRMGINAVSENGSLYTHTANLHS